MSSKTKQTKEGESRLAFEPLLCAGLSTEEAFALLPLECVTFKRDGYNYHYGFQLKKGYYSDNWVAGYYCLQQLSPSIEAKATTPKEALVDLYNLLCEMDLIKPCT